MNCFRLFPHVYVQSELGMHALYVRNKDKKNEKSVWLAVGHTVPMISRELFISQLEKVHNPYVQRLLRCTLPICVCMCVCVTGNCLSCTMLLIKFKINLRGQKINYLIEM